VLDEPRVRSAATAAAALLFFYFVQQRLWPAPAGVLIQGVVIGGLTALIAFGIALIYRANRIVNFAQGDLGAVPASLSVLLIVGPGVPYFLALPIGIAAGLLLGALVEFLLIRRFFKAPRLILTVVTIGISQILAGIGFLLPRLFDITTPPQSFPSPFDFSFNIGNTVFRGNDIIAMIAVVACIGALGFFFRYTNIGIAVRASAESADRASLLGVPVKRIETIVWAVASVLATVAVFLRAGIVGLPFGQLLGPAILVRALAAAVIGRMEKLPHILGASIGIGILEAAITFSTGRSILVDPILFLIVLAALLFQRRGQIARADPTSTWQAAREVRPIPRELVNLPEIRWGSRAVQALLIAFLAALPLILSESQINLAAVIVIISIVAVSLVVLSGWAGQVSLGQVAFLGIGAAIGGYLTTTRGWDLSLALLASGVAGAVAAMVIGLPALRIRGLLLAVTTLAFALATSSYALNEEFVTWLPTARFERPMLFGRIALDSEVRYYYFSLACLGLAIAAVRGVRQSRTGRVLIGVRENERAVQAFGVSAIGAKLTGFAFAGFLAAFAGGLFVHHQQGLGIQPYGVERSFQVFIMTVVGGLGSIPGAILGVVFIEGTEYFKNLFPETFRNLLKFFTSGVGLIFVLLTLPGGLGQGLYGIRDRALRYVADRRGIIVPSLTADARQPTADATTEPDDVQAELEAALASADSETPSPARIDDLVPGGAR
jgi:branched-chain amino acid transport system permease protein